VSDILKDLRHGSQRVKHAHAVATLLARKEAGFSYDGRWSYQRRTRKYREHKAKQRRFSTAAHHRLGVASDCLPSPTGWTPPCRTIVRRIPIEEQDGKGALFKSFRYRLVSPNLLPEGTAGQGS